MTVYQVASFLKMSGQVSLATTLSFTVLEKAIQLHIVLFLIKFSHLIKFINSSQPSVSGSELLLVDET